MLFVYLIWLTVRENRKGRRSDLWLPLLSDLLIAAAVVFDISSAYRPYPLSAFTAALVCGSVLYYLWLHLRFERDHERELLDGQHMQIMLGQIQPHFLYNSAVEAFQIRVQGYVMKPLTPEQVRVELSLLPAPPEPEPQKLRVQCFGNYEVFWQDEPLRFARRQMKELLAYLIDRRGALCNAEEIIAALECTERFKEKLRKTAKRI